MDLTDNLGQTGYNVLTEKTEKWKNSKYDIVFGDSTSFTLGLGRQTIVFGPDIKTILDWTVLFDWAGEKIKNKLGKFFWNGLWGQGGSTDFILGNKNIFNYGTGDFSITRKLNPTVKVEIMGKKDQFINTIKYPYYWQKFLVMAYATFQITLGILIRIKYMGVGINVQNAGEKEDRKKLVELLMFLQSVIGVRILALLQLVETLYFTDKSIDLRRKHLEESVRDVVDVLDDQGNVIQEQIIQPNPPEAVGQVYRDHVSRELRQHLDIVNANITRSAQRVLWDLGLFVDGLDQGNEVRNYTNLAHRWETEEDVTWNSGSGFTHCVNPIRFGQGDGNNRNSSSFTTFIQNCETFEQRLKYKEGQINHANYLQISKLFFRVRNSDPKSLISLNNGKDSDPSASYLKLTDGKITLGCGESNKANPALNMGAKESYLSISQGGIPKIKRGGGLVVPGRALFLNDNFSGLYGGERTDDGKTAAYIELKGKESLVIKLQDSEVRLDANGITIKSDKKITLDGGGGIELISGQSKLTVQENGVQIKSLESEFDVKPDGFSSSAAIRNNKEEAALKEKNSIQRSDCSAVSISKASMQQIGP